MVNFSASDVCLSLSFADGKMFYAGAFYVLLLKFLSVADSATKEDICYMDPDLGGCSAFNVKYYYNRFTGECHEFIFGGCLGNNNNFETLEECQEFCEGFALEKSCDKKGERGPCEGYLVRYYYDKETDECKTFIYGGCRGNTNNFRLQKECMETCSAAEE